MPLHPLFQQIVDDMQQLHQRPYRLYDDAQWSDLPDVSVEVDDGGAAYVVHDPAQRERELADVRERLHRPGNPFR